MKSSAELLSRNLPKDNPLALEMAGFITTEVDRTNSLITRFLDFARPQHMRLEKGDLAAHYPPATRLNADESANGRAGADAA